MRLALLLVGLLGTILFFAGRGGLPTLANDEAISQTTYYGNGQARSTTTWVQGVRQGEAIEWHPDGKVASQGLYADGLREGEWLFWREDGSVDESRSGTYVGGKRGQVAAVDRYSR